jgi:hypothetical protein
VVTRRLRDLHAHPLTVLVVALIALGLTAIDGEAADAPVLVPRIENLEVRRDDTALAVAFAVADAIGPETLERVHCGMPLTFRHRAELVARRRVPLWPARVLASVVVESTVRFDALTRQYTIERRVRTRQRDEPPREIDERERTDSLDSATAWLTTFPATELYRGRLDGEARLRLRVSSDLERRYVLWLLPTRVGVAAEQDLGP